VQELEELEESEEVLEELSVTQLPPTQVSPSLQ
jgi:hypothetical protein